MVHTRGTMVFEVAGFEIEIDHDGQAGGGAVFLRLAGQTHNLPIPIGATAQLGAALDAVGTIAGNIERAVDHLSAENK